MDFGRLNLKFRQMLVLMLLQGACMSCRAETPQASLTDVGGESSVSSTQIVEEKGKPQILERVVVTQVGGVAADGTAVWRVDVKSVGEVWCERRCSHFELIENQQEGVISLGARKTVVLGNTEPGMLDVSREFKSSKDHSQKIKIVNVGAVGETIVLSPSDFGPDRPNFYALPMRMAIRQLGAKMLVIGRFDGREVEVRFAANCQAPKLSDESGPKNVFVMGSLIEGDSKTSPSTPSYFIVRKLIFPLSEN